MSLIPNYNPLPINFTHGKGAWLYDANNQAYLDAMAGIAVNGLGYTHPDITNTIVEQASKVLHVSNLYHIAQQTELANKLTTMTGTKQAFFANSGAEANETAIKLTRLYGHKKHIETPSIIVMERAFHGRTMATLTASDSRKVRAGFEPFVPGFIRAPFNDIEAIHTIAANRDDVVAVMLEPIQGEGGIHVAATSYLRMLADLCQQHEWLLILDEVQTGNARTGKYFSFMHTGIQPDILTTAKGLGNGIPIGACLIGEKASDLFKVGSHGSTLGGNPLACATALTVLEVIERDNICDLVTQNSAVLKEQLMLALGEHPNVRAIRGVGYMLGIELDKPANDARMIGLEHGILFSVTAENTIRILPPLIIDAQEINELVLRLTKTIQQFCH